MENALGFLSQLSDSQTNRTWVVYKTAVIPNDALIWIEDEKGSTRTIKQSQLAELGFTVKKPGLKKTYSNDVEKLGLYCDANRILEPSISNPFSALDSSNIIALPHQLTAVYDIMLPLNPIRFLLADDPGAGKTIMSGLLIKELLLRNRIKNILIVSPGNLAPQWIEELSDKFSMNFSPLDANQMLKDRDYFIRNPFLVSRMDVLSRNTLLQERLSLNHFDMVIVDEAHKLSARTFGGETKYTSRYKLGRILSDISTNFLLLTATPHDGKPEDFRFLMSLIDSKRYTEKGPELKAADVAGSIRRIVKEDMVNFDGTHLFPERESVQCSFDLKGLEYSLYQDVTEYVRKQYNLAQKLSNSKRTCIGFVMTLLQRRLASSPMAIYLTLERRKKKLQERLDNFDNYKEVYYSDILYDIDSYDDGEDEDEKHIDETSSATKADLAQEIQTLDDISKEARQVIDSCSDAKWHSLSELLQKSFLEPDSSGKYPKVIIFTESADTLDYLSEKVGSVIGINHIGSIKGGMTTKQRQKIQKDFWNNPRFQILLATDAADEGINLQCAHLMINYDLPWNPNRLEQRFGRIHRIGQSEKCFMFNLIAENTREGLVFKTLMEKIEEEKKALGNQVYNVLNEITFKGQSLSDILKNITLGISSGTAIEIDHSKISQVIAENDELNTNSSISKAKCILEEIESSKPTKIQPFIIRDFVAKALSLYGSSLKVARLNDLYSIDEVPAIVQATEKGKIKSKYTAISFDSQKANEEEVEYIGLKHPLVIGLANTVISSCKGSDLSCVAIDQNDSGDSLPFFVKNVDSEVCYNPSRFADSSATTIISKDSSFFKTDAKGGKQWTISPYLDYSSLTDTELANLALNVLISKLPLLLPMEDALNGLATQYVQSRSKGVIDASIESCQKRSQKQLLGLTTRRNQLEGLIYELENNKKLDDKGRAKLSEYRESIKKIDDMLSLMVPKGTDRNCYSYKYSLDKVSFLVIPKAYIEKTPFSETIDKKTEDEKLAIDAVIKTEVSLGFVANDRGEIKGTGYDIISSGIESGKNTIRRIEVKGIQSGCNVVDVTRNEINCSLNTPESFILAIGWVYSDRIELKYIKNPFFKILFKTKGENVDDSIASISFNINSLEKNGDVILSKTIER